MARCEEVDKIGQKTLVFDDNILVTVLKLGKGALLLRTSHSHKQTLDVLSPGG